MIQFLTDAGKWIVDFFNTLSNLILSAINGIASVIKSFPKILSLITASLNFVPTVFIGFISITAIILIVYIIIGRNAGNS